MHIVYKITYIPHIGTDYPKYYIGSKFNYKPGYFGSVASNKILPFTEDLTLKKWWKTRNKSDFKIEILFETDNIEKSELLNIELKIQKEHDIINDDYFNSSFANGKFLSRKRTIEERKNISEKTKKYWNTPEGIKKKQRLIENNKRIKSIEMKNRWTDSEFREKTIKRHTLPKSINHRNNISKGKSTIIEYKNNFYYGYKNLEQNTGVTKHLYKKYYLNGFDPEINIGNKRPKKVPL